MNYRLQEGRYGDNWQDHPEYPRDASDLAAWIQIGNNQDDHDGRYHYRIVDEQGDIVWTKIPPYERLKINVVGDSANWMDSLRENYAISKEQFAAACRAWLVKEEHS